MRAVTRRAALLGGVGLALSGCDSVTDTFDRWFGESKVPLRGDRKPVLATERGLGVDEGFDRAVTLPPATAMPNWPQAGGVPSHAPGHPALGPGLRQLWSRSAGTGGAYRRRLVGPPVLADGTLFVADAVGRVTAMDAASGRERWSFDSRPEDDRQGALGAGLAHEGGVLYVVTGLAEAMALDAATGAPGWRVPLPAPARGAPTVAGGRLFVPTIENHLVALSAANGDKLWTHRAQPVTTMMLGLPAPAVEGEVVVAGFASGELVALRAQDGKLSWSEALSSSRGGGMADIAAITALPVIDRGRVFAAGLGGLAISIDLRSGRRLWERDVAVAETPWVAGDWLFLVTSDANLACIGREDGRVRWASALARYGNPAKRRDPITWGPPVVAGGRILIAGSHERLLELSPADGSTLSETRLPSGATLAPAVAGGILYVLTDGGDVVAFQGSGPAA
ncbi:outer membrane protein assembly factor BamB family protein [Roseicella aquatilis]|nr:PQQ-binding-like beta-propeller repeat protein [Roseicella aquatilis]